MPLIKPDAEKLIFELMYKQFSAMGCRTRIINGMPDHVHCLFLLSPKVSVAEVMKQVKGSTSHFINEHHLINEKFEWQKGYAAFAVSESIVPKVHEYILNQKSHHTGKASKQEYEAFLRTGLIHIDMFNG